MPESVSEITFVESTVQEDVVDAVVSFTQISAMLNEAVVEAEFSASVVEAEVGETVVHAAVVGMQGPPGVDGADATGQRTFSFEWGDATPALLMSAAAGQMVLGVTVSIDEPFDGVGAAISVGDAGDDGSLIDSGMIEPTVVGAFQNAPCLRFVSATQLFLTITPGTGASTGSGVVSLFLE